MSGRVFDGLKVIDCASFIAGPAAATVLSDFGAETVKIEPPGAGDPYRRRATPPVGPGLADNPGFVLDGRNKASLALDLQQEAGRLVLHRLVAAADVFITNYPPPVRRRLGITYEELAPLNERLVYASSSGYGETGPEADKPGFDATAWWARSGLMHLVRAGVEAAPARSLPGMGDHPSAMATYGAIVTALYQRERTGKGACVGSSLLANGLWANGCSVQPHSWAKRSCRSRRANVASMRCASITAAATTAGSCCRSPRTNGAGTGSRPASGPRLSMTPALRRRPCASATRAN